jgi:hypothetical protein
MSSLLAARPVFAGATCGVCLAVAAAASGAACTETAVRSLDAGIEASSDQEVEGSVGVSDAIAAEVGPCFATDVTQISACSKLLGYTWTGARCEPVSGCGCGPPFCDAAQCMCPPYQSNDDCVAAHLACGACAANNATAAPDCSATGQLKWAWTGTTCVSFPPGCCVGSDCCATIGCGTLWDFQSDCETYHQVCPDFADAGPG